MGRFEHINGFGDKAEFRLCIDYLFLNNNNNVSLFILKHHNYLLAGPTKWTNVLNSLL